MVEEAVVAKKLVEVELVMVAVTPVKVVLLMLVAEKLVVVALERVAPTPPEMLSPPVNVKLTN